MNKKFLVTALIASAIISVNAEDTVTTQAVETTEPTKVLVAAESTLQKLEETTTTNAATEEEEEEAKKKTELTPSLEVTQQEEAVTENTVVTPTAE